MLSEVRVREATAADHRAFARLFPELLVDGPVLDEEQFVRTLMPTTLMAESPAAGTPVGYVYFEIMKDTTYVRHLVTAPEARRTGVARALLSAVVARARAAGCSTWRLNVKPGNTPALKLYEALGLKRAYTSRALNLSWSAIESAPRSSSNRATARDIAPDEDASVETAMRLVDGQITSARAVSGRIIKLLEEDGRVVGATIFHPDFPGASPFRVARPALALVLLLALREHARPEHEKLMVLTEDQPDVAEALLVAGATVRLEAVHLSGLLPA